MKGAKKDYVNFILIYLLLQFFKLFFRFILTTFLTTSQLGMFYFEVKSFIFKLFLIMKVFICRKFITFKHILIVFLKMYLN